MPYKERSLFTHEPLVRGDTSRNGDQSVTTTAATTTTEGREANSSTLSLLSLFSALAQRDGNSGSGSGEGTGEVNPAL